MKIINFKKEEFYPGVFSLIFKKVYLDRRALLKKVMKYKDKVTGRVLDVGCGSKPYEILFSKSKEYVGIDIENPGHDHRKENIDFYFDGKNIPFENESFDTVVIFQVIEHVKDLDKLLLEIKRVLKPKGKIIASFPFLWQLHELPHDYRRFSPNGAKRIFENNGFKVLINEKTLDNFGIFFQFGQFFLDELGRNLHKSIRVLFFPFIFLLNLFGLIFSIFKTSTLYAENFLILEKK